MDKFLADASTAYWWITAVLVGLVINLASAYIKNPIDRVAASLSGRWRARTEGLRKARSLHVEYLKAHPESRAEFRAMEARIRLKGVHELARSCVALLMLITVFVVLLYNPKPDEQHVVHYAVEILAAALALLFFASFTAAATHHGRADDFERQLREAGSA
jgi:hypothetical protein